ncbi:hypothetical protein SKAU_G00375420 [Synaphobranchus kaupii]|uniref:Uncharacterized protein n=1 Tax=Synaphobranchus kaupii TaxID=118154 RepID=A0A9Q1EGV2_SYNKA|nr:hypothetical protein SKAU_G00375420 [Synaphobranchus kaupii]
MSSPPPGLPPLPYGVPTATSYCKQMNSGPAILELAAGPWPVLCGQEVFKRPARFERFRRRGVWRTPAYSEVNAVRSGDSGSKRHAGEKHRNKINLVCTDLVSPIVS